MPRKCHHHRHPPAQINEYPSPQLTRRRAAFGATTWQQAIAVSRNARAVGYLGPSQLQPSDVDLLDGLLTYSPIAIATPVAVTAVGNIRYHADFYAWATMDPWTRDFFEALDWYPDEPFSFMEAIAHAAT